MEIGEGYPEGNDIIFGGRGGGGERNWSLDWTGTRPAIKHRCPFYENDLNIRPGAASKKSKKQENLGIDNFGEGG